MTTRLPIAGPAWLRFGRAAIEATLDDTIAAGGADDRSAEGGPSTAIATARDAVPDLAVDGALGALAGNAGLDADAIEVLAILATVEVDQTVQRTIARARGDATRRRMSLGTIALVTGAAHTGARTLAPDGALRRAAFVDVVEFGPWSEHEVVLHPTVVWALLGDGSADPDLPVGIERASSDDVGAHAVVVVSGRDRIARRVVGTAAALGDRFLVAEAPESAGAWDALVREATITGSGIVVELGEHLSPTGRRVVERARHLAWVLSAEHPPQIDDLPSRTWHEVEATAADATRDDWHAAFGDDAEPSHHLTLEQLDRVARVRPAVGGDTDAAVRRLAAGKLEQLTRRIRPTRTWDDIVLSPDRLELLRSIVDRVRHGETVYDRWGFSVSPSRGLVALFAGPSGTGKTLSAEVVAGALGLDLFKLDLSSVVSKYIGETEKNLDQVFDAAGAGNSVLFFDEADSLFGKRSEVKDARDRYANLEVSYLLQRLEAYDGLVVLATNYEKNVDEAFARRVHVRIEYAIPGPDERVALWRQSFPKGAPLADDLDIDWLARQFEIAGGAIRNSALSAGFLAAAAGTDVTMQCAVRGIAREYRKLGRLITPKDFGEHHDLV